jgi:hypothetical protein
VSPRAPQPNEEPPREQGRKLATILGLPALLVAVAFGVLVIAVVLIVLLG